MSKTLLDRVAELHSTPMNTSGVLADPVIHGVAGWKPGLDPLGPSGAPKAGGSGSGSGKGKPSGGSNSAPTDIALSNEAIDENSAGGTIVGTLSAVDPDAREKFTYQLLNDGGSRFVIDGNKLKVASGASLDYETESSIDLLVQVTDSRGNTHSEWMTISLLDVDETVTPPPPPPPPPAETPYYVDALIGTDSQRWNYGSEVGTPVTVGFTFLTSVPGYYSQYATEQNSFQAFTASQQAATRDILSTIETFANISFLETTNVADAKLTFGNANLGANYGAWAYYPSVYDSRGGDVWVNNYYGSQLNANPGNYAYQTIIHEAGHAIGLTHPGDYDVSGGSGTLYLPASEDNRQYTVMSYTKHPSMGSVEPQTMLLYDIAAVQHLYGANMGQATGNDVYNFGSANNLIKAVWDAGGYDTFSVAGSNVGAVLNLNDGAFSSVGTRGGAGTPATNNVAIAFGAQIEAAVGGNGADLLTGNALDNSLTGGAGSDEFMFLADWGMDIVTDFADGLDQIVFGGLGIDFGDLAIADTVAGATIGYGDDTVLLSGVASAQLGASDFAFV